MKTLAKTFPLPGRTVPQEATSLWSARSSENPNPRGEHSSRPPRRSAEPSHVDFDGVSEFGPAEFVPRSWPGDELPLDSDT